MVRQKSKVQCSFVLGMSDLAKGKDYKVSEILSSSFVLPGCEISIDLLGVLHNSAPVFIDVLCNDFNECDWVKELGSPFLNFGDVV